MSELKAVSAALDAIAVGFCAFDASGRVLVWNRTLAALLPGLADQIGEGEPFVDTLRRLPPERLAGTDPGALLQYLGEGINDGAGPQPFSFMLDGRTVAVSFSELAQSGRISVWRCQGDQAGAALASAEQVAREAETRYRLLAELSSDVIATVVDGRLDYLSPSVERLLGWKPEELAGHAYQDLLSAEHATMLDAALAMGMSQPFQARARRADGMESWVEVAVTQAPDAPRTVVLNIRDISARKSAETQLEQVSRELEALAHTDALTGAANRRSFDLSLEAEWRRASRDRKPLALLLFDVDFFKRLNDQHGHPAGDEVLRRLALQLRNHARRPGDLHARYGGEEFALILPATGAGAAVQIAEDVRRGFSACFADRPELASSVSVGVAVAPDDAASTVELLQHADQALYRAKALGRDRSVRWQRPAA